MSTPRPSPAPRFGVLFLLFFVSGVSGLIYESMWSRYLRQFVGSASTAQILVLSLFMGGMSVGAMLSGRLMPRLRSPVFAYGVIEGIIGAYALAFPWLHEAVGRLSYDVIFPALGGGGAVTLAKWGMATLLILPPCVLLGMTFPLMSVGILRRDPGRSGEILSSLYFSNSLGASLGALLSGFALVPNLGLPGSLAVAAALNLAIMVVALRERTPSAPLVPPAAASSSAAPMVWLFLAIAFGTGLSSFMYEIAWIRLLSMILGSATHSFEVMLSAFVFGLAVGGFWVKKRMDRFKKPIVVLALVQLIMGIAAITTIPAYQLAVLAMSELLGQDERTTMLWLGFNVVRYLLCLLIMLPATFCAGMTLPLLTHVMLKSGQPEGIVGRIYGFNTLGAIAGAVVSGIVLLPLIGLKLVIVAGAAVDMALAILILRSEWRRTEQTSLRRGTQRATLVAVAWASLGIWVLDIDPMVMTSTVFREGRLRLPAHYKILSYVDGKTASVTVVRNGRFPGYHIIYTNGKPDASVILNRWPEGRKLEEGPEMAGDEPNQFLVGLVPLMARPEAKRAALIGFGSGVTCHTVLGSPHLERLDTIEIEEEMVAGSRYFLPQNVRAYEDPRNHLIFDDAKAFFATASAQYDLIISEPTNPWVSGVSSLFTVDFYREAKRYLKPGGVLAQWLQGYELGNELLTTVLAALDQEFSDYVVVRIGERDWVILSVAQGQVGTLSAAPLAWEGMRDIVSLLGIHDIGQVDALITANRQMLHPFLASATANTDAYPILDTGAERARFMRLSAEFMGSLRWTPAPLLRVLGGIEARPYPEKGIGDLRSPHVLAESEQAVLLLRTYADPAGTRAAPHTSDASMREWLAETQNLGTEAGDWAKWTRATYEAYRLIVPYVPVHETKWWADVMRHESNATVPEVTRRALAVLDTLAPASDGPKLLRLVETELASSDSVLPRPFLTIAGVVAHEISGSEPTTRRAFADRFMNTPPTADDSTDVAYRAIRAYASR